MPSKRFVYVILTPHKLHAYSSHAKREAVLTRAVRWFKIPPMRTPFGEDARFPSFPSTWEFPAAEIR